MANVTVKIRTGVEFASMLRATAQQAATRPSAAEACGLAPELVGWMLEVARAIEQTHKDARPELRPFDAHDPSLPCWLRRQAD